MARVIKKQDLESILRAVNNLPQGGDMEDVERLINLPISRQALRNRLRILHEQGKIYIKGVRRGTKYYPLQNGDSVDYQSVIPLSAAAEEVRAYVNRPEASRAPVGYRQEFLDDYQPNVTSYLSPAEKDQLREIGRTSQSSQPAGTYGREILNRLMIDLSWNSSRLEGNTYSLLDTQRLFDLGQAAEGKSPADAQMILNHKAAIEFLVDSAGDIGFNRYTILNLHAQLADNLLPDPRAVGRLRSTGVGIARSVFQPLENPQRIEENFNVLLAKASAIEDPFEQAFFIMVQLPYLQPFDDVNKRVSRLAANIPLLRDNLAPLSFVDMPDGAYIQGVLGVYELNRVDLLKDVFLWAYQRSAARYSALRQSLGEPDPFRIRYRTQLQTVVRRSVEEQLTQPDAMQVITREAAGLPAADQQRFCEMAADELLALHEGNFARYRIAPAAFEQWKALWRTK